MRERMRDVLEKVAVVGGISGMTLSDLRNSAPILYWTLIVLLVLCLWSLLSRPKEPNVFTDKTKIDEVWKRSLKGAKTSVRILAGDASWAPRDAGDIAQLVNAGVQVSVLAHAPRKSPGPLAHLAVLLKAGARVRFFDPMPYPSLPYGLLVDHPVPDAETALRVDKSPRRSVVDPKADESIYDHQAIRYLPPSDAKTISTIAALYESLWRQSRQGVVLLRADPDRLSSSKLLPILHTVLHYGDLAPTDIEVTSLDVSQLHASCTYVKLDKLQILEPVVMAYLDQGVDPFEPQFCLSHQVFSLLLPPIVERHGDRLVVVDGTHRLFALSGMHQRSVARCIVLNNRGPLPGEPIPWHQVKAWPRKLPRSDVFVGYKPVHYRQFVPFDNRLRAEAGA